jgi:NAD(P)-dependent dehydrogenase (short-subunit alcohol dehydrogenase family)
MPARTWFVTGAARGLGRAIVDAALSRGDTVVATTRQPDALAADLAAHGARAIVLALDVTDRGAVLRAVNDAVQRTSGLDVVVNNAGYGMAGAVEEVTEAQARAQLETNFFGALSVTQAALPHLRKRGRGHLVQVSSVGGLVAAPNLGLYHASKWALEGMSESLAREVAPFGIKVTLVEPSGMRTDWSGSSMQRAAPLSAYDDVLAGPRRHLDGSAERREPGDPTLAAQAVLQVVDEADPPLRLLLGNAAFDHTRTTYEARLSEFAAWESLTRSIDVPAPVVEVPT